MDAISHDDLDHYEDVSGVCIENIVAFQDEPFAENNEVSRKIVNQWEHLKKVGYGYDEQTKIEILIGQDNHQLLEQLVKVKGPRKRDPWGVLTPLGWTFYGLPRDRPLSTMNGYEKLKYHLDAVKERGFVHTCKIQCPSRHLDLSDGIASKLEKLWETEEPRTRSFKV